MKCVHQPKESVCGQDGGGRVDLESLKDGELDYGCDQAGLAELRHRTRKAVHNYEGLRETYALLIDLMMIGLLYRTILTNVSLTYTLPRLRPYLMRGLLEMHSSYTSFLPCSSTVMHAQLSTQHDTMQCCIP